jgi:large subunit ribosomal protein L5
MGNVPRLQEQYQKVREALAKELGLENPNEIPRIQKIVVNIGQGEAVQNHKILEGAVADLEKITGQKPVLTKAKKSIAGFKHCVLAYPSAAA